MAAARQRRLHGAVDQFSRDRRRTAGASVTAECITAKLQARPLDARADNQTGRDAKPAECGRRRVERETSAQRRGQRGRGHPGREHHSRAGRRFASGDRVIAFEPARYAAF